MWSSYTYIIFRLQYLWEYFSVDPDYSDDDTVSCLGGGGDTAWVFDSEYSVSLWDEIAKGLHARSFAGLFFFFATTRFGTIPYRD
jgi:hypothetical protein